MNRGLYLLANDAVVDKTVAIINSLYASGYGGSICIIPFDNSTNKLRSVLGDTVEYFEDEYFLSQCDSISNAVHRVCHGHYRKLAIWRGPFDEFLYIDADCVVMDNIDYVFALLEWSDILVGHSNDDTARHWVWKNSIYNSGYLSKSQIEYSGMTGVIASKRNVIDDFRIKSALNCLSVFLPHMELRTREQAFLNLLFASSGARCSSLNILRHQGIGELWCGDAKAVIDKNHVLYYNGVRTRVTIVHWAGMWRHSPLETQWRRLLKYFPIRSDLSPIPRGLRHRHVWLYHWNRRRLRTQVCT